MKKLQVEVEIKSLLGSKENADKLLSRMSKHDPSFAKSGDEKQLNHYFTQGDNKKLATALAPHLSKDQQELLSHIYKVGTSFSVRTRKSDETVLFVVKAVVDSTTSSNGTARLEFEEKIPTLSLEKLDKIILNSGFEYEAKWSRERTSYSFLEYVVSIDKNAGYGYLSEFERLVPADVDLELVKSQIRGWFQKLEIQELPQDRLARMFSFYNKNWPKYYGTDNIFVIE